MSMAGLRYTVPIPEFQFTNRQREIAEVYDFLTGPEARGQLLLVLSPGGYGKSRLLEQVTLNPPGSTALLFLNSKRHGASEAGLSASFVLEAERLLIRLGLRHVADPVTDGYHKSAHFLGGVVPKLARGAPLVGAAAEYTAETLVDVLSHSSAAHVDPIRRSFERLASRLPGGKLVILVDDVHALQLTEQYVLADIITLGREFSGADIRYIFGSRPLNAAGPGPVRDLCERIAIDGKLTRIDLPRLEDDTMREIAVSLASNPVDLELVIETADGNPQAFLSSLMALNLDGALTLDQGMLRVPVNTIELGSRLGSILERLDIVARRIVSTLAVARHDVTYDSLRNTSALFGAATASEVVTALQKLAQIRLLGIRTAEANGPRDVGVYVRHDSIRDLIRSELQTSFVLEYLFANEIAAELADYQLKSLDSQSKPAASEAERHALVIGRAICRREAQRSGWESESIEALVSAEHSARLNDVVDLGASLLQAFRAILHAEAEPRRSVARMFVRANYQLGRYTDCIAASEDEQLEDGESLYLRAISYAIVKPDSNTVIAVRDVRRRAQESAANAAWDPLLLLTEAVALQESGCFTEATRLYDVYMADAPHNRDTLQFWQFACASPLFVGAKQSIELTHEAFEWFEARGHDRSAGMAANNRGYAAMQLRDYDLALHCFDVSITLLSRNDPHEAVFPLTNIAFVRILRAEATAAITALTSCLFRRLWPEYEASVLINMAYATWLAGWNDPGRFLRRIRRTPGMKRDAWSVALEEYARSVLQLLPTVGAPSEADLLERFETMRHLDAFAAIAPYWNALVRDVRERFGLDGTQVSVAGMRTTMSQTTDPSISIARPSGCCFAHI